MRRCSPRSAFGALAGLGGVGYALDAVDEAVNGASARVTPASVQYASGTCVESVNPHGQTIPPAGQTPPGNGPGQNEDGFYEIGSDGSGDVVVTDLGSGTVFGPYPSGTVIKYTQATGATPARRRSGATRNGQAGAVTVHITGTGDFSVTPVGGGTSVTCLVHSPSQVADLRLREPLRGRRPAAPSRSPPRTRRHRRRGARPR